MKGEPTSRDWLNQLLTYLKRKKAERDLQRMVEANRRAPATKAYERNREAQLRTRPAR